MRAACLKAALAFAFALLLPLGAWGHATSQAYLSLREHPQGTELRVDLALRDLDLALDLDANGDNQLTWGELRHASSAVARWVLSGVQLQGCAAGFSAQEGVALESRADGVYAAVTLLAPCPLPSTAQAPLRYTLLGTQDPTHRALLRWTPQGSTQLLLLNPLKPPVWPAAMPAQAQTQTQMQTQMQPELPMPTPVQPLSPQHPHNPGSNPMHATPAALLMLAAPVAAQAQAQAQIQAQTQPTFLFEGVAHLLGGYDHILFLMCLLLPAVLARTAHQLQPVGQLKAALLPVLGMVTAFTLAHSITLALAALGHATVSPAVIEPLIALSIVITALDNLKPFLSQWLRAPRWAIAFGFGLIHGFGFAGVLAELELPAGQLAWALLQFNLGLELAQLGVVVLAMGVLWQLRRWQGYPRWVMGLGSSFAALLGTFWVVQRLG
jgi:HupE / UreJ protein